MGSFFLGIVNGILAKFAEEVYERLKQTQDDFKAAMAAYRELLRKMD